MKYLIILYAEYNDGKDPKKSMYEAGTSTEAVASFHSYMSIYMNDKTVRHVMVMVINSSGIVLKNETFER